MQTLTRRQKDVIPEIVAYILAEKGRTVDELNTKLPGDQSQIKLRFKHVWHTKAGLDTMVAEELRLPQSLWGPTRKSRDLRRATVNEINKMRKRGELVDWRKGKRINVFRLCDLNRHAKRPLMTSMQGVSEPVAESTDESMRGLFMSIISQGRKDNTYKFALGKTLLDYCKSNAPDGSAHKISYDYLAGEFLKHYWHQRFRFRMKQDFYVKKRMSVIRILEGVFKDKPPIRYKDIPDSQLKEARDLILTDVFGPDTGMVVPKFQKTRDGNTTRDNKLFYDYDDDLQTITLNPKAHSFFSRNNHILTRALLAEWVLYL